MAMLAVRGRQYRRRRQMAGAAATMALGGAVLATGWYVEVLRGARQAGELEQRAVGEGEARGDATAAREHGPRWTLSWRWRSTRFGTSAWGGGWERTGKLWLRREGSKSLLCRARSGWMTTLSETWRVCRRW